MSWNCKLLDVVGTRLVRFEPKPGDPRCGETRLLTADGQEHSYSDLPAGSMFYVPENPIVENDDPVSAHWPWYLASPERLSDFYRQRNSHRRPLLVVLPGKDLFLVDGKCWNEKGMYGGWEVTGEAPLITVSPSINIVGFYHGWLRNGIISDDCEGRKFTADGFRA
ncbi:MAG: hypothetical protein KGL35_04315 [Bradyrhizobium sp.]|nr:hypothetical protein [Bradyrhizobium sp.]